MKFTQQCVLTVPRAEIRTQRDNGMVDRWNRLQKGVLMSTGKKPGHDASRQLRNPQSTPAQRRVAASDLAQRPHPKKSK